MNILQNKLVMRIKDMITQDESLLLQQILSTTSIGNVRTFPTEVVERIC